MWLPPPRAGHRGRRAGTSRGEARRERGVEHRARCSSAYSRALDGRRQVDLEHAGVRRDREPQSVGRRTAAGSPRAGRRCPCRGARRRSRVTSSQKSVGPRQRRQEHVHRAVARLDAERGPHPGRPAGTLTGNQLALFLLLAGRTHVEDRWACTAPPMARRADPRPQRAQRQPQADGAVTRQQEQVAPPEHPVLARPAPIRLPRERQHEAHLLAEPISEHSRQAPPLLGVPRGSR